METRREFMVGLGAGGLSVLAAPILGRAEESIRTSIEIIPRTKWADAAPRLNRMRKASGFSRLTVHHAGGEVRNESDLNAVIFRLQAVQTGHLNRRYGDIGYHFIIDRAGRVWEGRSLAYEGAHVSAANAGNIGIMVLGNFEKQRPAGQQLSAVRTLVEHLQDRCRITRTNVFGHRDLGHSVCPGRHLYGHVMQLRKANGGNHAVGRGNRRTT